jgi:hypothetical protein
MDYLLLLLGGGTVGAIITGIIAWLRFRKVDDATAMKSRAEGQAAIHTSESNALSISSTLLGTWMTVASTAQEKIQELERANGKCLDDLEKERNKQK